MVFSRGAARRCIARARSSLFSHPLRSPSTITDCSIVHIAAATHCNARVESLRSLKRGTSVQREAGTEKGSLEEKHRGATAPSTICFHLVGRKERNRGGTRRGERTFLEEETNSTTGGRRPCNAHHPLESAARRARKRAGVTRRNSAEGRGLGWTKLRTMEKICLRSSLTKSKW